MPAWTPQRKLKRYLVALPLQYRPQGVTPEGTGVGWTRTLSSGGAEIEVGESLPPQTVLQLRLQTGRGVIEAEARVIWGGPPSAASGTPHGVTFTRLAPDQLQALEGFLLSFDPWPRARGRVPINVAACCRPRWPAGSDIHGRTVNLSRRGGLFHLPEIVLPSTVLDITLSPPSGPLQLGGMVSWVDPSKQWSPGMETRHGVLFTPLDWQTSLILARLLTGPPEGSLA